VIVVFFINLWFDYSLQQKYDFTFWANIKKTNVNIVYIHFIIKRFYFQG